MAIQCGMGVLSGWRIGHSANYCDLICNARSSVRRIVTSRPGWQHDLLLTGSSPSRVSLHVQPCAFKEKFSPVIAFESKLTTNVECLRGSELRIEFTADYRVGSIVGYLRTVSY